MATQPFQRRRWTRKEYARLGELGVFRPGEPVELIGGELIVSEPIGSPHASAVGLTADALHAAFGAGWVVRVQAPVALDDDSEPEPDVVVVPGHHRDYRDAHPSHAAVLVEVADSSLVFDREEKASLYARAGMRDYWIVNLIDRALEVYREPAPDASAPLGWRYAAVDVLSPGATVSPLSRPQARIAVADLLP
jgi:Uma2 family endonuclease